LSEESKEKLSELYKSEIGFTRVVQLLIASKKPLIGHNPQYDVCFLYEKFVAPLPETFIEFCCAWRKHFPVTFDTKVVFFELKKDPVYNRSTLTNIF